MSIKLKLSHKTAEDFCVQLEQNDISVKYIGHSYLLTHNKTDDEFDKLVIAICAHLNLKPQNDDWFPGNPDISMSESFGYYVCPIDPLEYNDDFDMFISKSEITWC